MTEEQWLAAPSPHRLLPHVRRSPQGLRTAARRRKCRLFGCACLRRLAEGSGREPPLAVVDAAERYADELIGPEQAREVWDRNLRLDWASWPWALQAWFFSPLRPDARAAALVWQGLSDPEFDSVRGNSSAAERRWQAAIFRDIFGNPFRPVSLDPGWRTPAVVALAEGIYADRAWDRLPILADALEDAGCAHPDVVGHLRGPGPHARGCWVVDLILGKS